MLSCAHVGSLKVLLHPTPQDYLAKCLGGLESGRDQHSTTSQTNTHSYNINIDPSTTDSKMEDVAQKTQQAMETAMAGAAAGAAEVSRYGRRIVKKLWDPEPTNDRSLNKPVWCLGRQYINDINPQQQPDDPHPSTSNSAASPSLSSDPVIVTPPESSNSSFSSSLAYDHHDEDAGWPPSFLDDFESRIWLTYRSGFEPIPRSNDPKALASLSFTMRLKSLTDQGGFSSDSGWGCMIRSGQSLLANALVISQLGRGTCLLMKDLSRLAVQLLITDPVRLASRPSRPTGARAARSFRR